MGSTGLTVQLQDFSAGISGPLVWRDVTTFCKRIVADQGHNKPRSFMPDTGEATYIFNNVSGAYTPVGNRESADSVYLEVGRRIRHIVTLPTHAKALRVSYNNATTLNAGYLSQSGISASVSSKHQISLEFEARCESGFLRNAIRTEIRTNAPEVCEGEVFELTRKWRAYTITFLAQSAATSLEVRFYNLFTADATNIEFRYVGLFTSAAPTTNRITNPNFTGGSTGWSGTNATLTGISDYEVKFDGTIQSVVPDPFALAGDQSTVVVATDGVDRLQQASAKFALQKNKRADELIETVLSNLPVAYWVQAPAGKLLARGHQVFDRSFTGYTERETTLYDAISDAVESENGLFWADQDGTYRFESNTFPSRRARREGVVRPSWVILQANPADGDVIGFFGATYRFKNTLAAAYDVKIGTDAKTTAQNLVYAIMMDAATMGSSYHAATPIHPTCEATLADSRSTILADAPDMYLRLGEPSGGTAFDSSGFGRNGTYNGPTLGVAGAIPSDSDTAASFDGVNDIVSLTTLPLYYSSFTIAMWLKAGASPPATQDIFSAYSAFVVDQAFYIRINSNGSISVDFYLDATTTATGVIVFGASTYQYLVVTFDLTTRTLSIYVNGLLVQTATLSYFTSTVSPTLTLGGFPAAGSTPFKGSIDDLSIYLKTISSTRVATHYAARYAGVAMIKYRDINLTPELVLNEATREKYTMRPQRSVDTVVNKCAVTWRPRQSTVAVIALAQIQGAIQIPPKSTTAGGTLVKPGFSNVPDGRVGQQTLTLTFRDAAGNTISGENVVDPVATTDYKVFERADGTGYEYTTQTQYFWISDIKKLASQFVCTLNNYALGALYATFFQVRGNAIYNYDQQEEQSVNQTSINMYRERQMRRDMPFTNDQQFAKSLSGYTVERYGTPFVETPVVETTLDSLNGTYLMSLGLMDTIVITDAKSGLNGVRHMIIGITTILDPSKANYVDRIRFRLERLDQNQYFILSDSTYGVVGGSSRLYI